MKFTIIGSDLCVSGKIRHVILKGKIMHIISMVNVYLKEVDPFPFPLGEVGHYFRDGIGEGVDGLEAEVNGVSIGKL